MNTADWRPEPPDPAEWHRPELRSVLLSRDVRAIYRYLQRIGFSQQRIAALAGQSQPEVSSILSGRRVTAYDVLARIADGLRIPRGFLRMAYTADGSEHPGFSEQQQEATDPAEPQPERRPDPTE
jgi:transcriptional regulator with XRE-family HTH domain